LCPES